MVTHTFVLTKKFGFSFFVCVFACFLTVPAAFADDKNQDMEPEIRFMPQYGPPKMVPKGSQNVTPQTHDPNNPMDMTGMIVPMTGPAPADETNPMDNLMMGPPGFAPPKDLKVDPNGPIMMPQYGPIQTPNQIQNPMPEPRFMPQYGPPASAGPNTAKPPVQAESGKATDGTKLPLPKSVTEEPAGGGKGVEPHTLIHPGAPVNGSFSEVSGLELETPPIDYRTGDEDTVMRKIPGMSKYSNVVMKRGPADAADFEAYDVLKAGGDSLRARDMQTETKPKSGMQQMQNWMEQ